MQAISLLIISFFPVIVNTGFVSSNKNVSDPIASDPDHDTEFVHILHKTILDIQSIKVTGDPDYDFASMFILHHQGGIALLKKVIEKGSDPVIMNFAKRLKKNQEKELKVLRKFAANYVPGSVNVYFIKAMRYFLEKTKHKINNEINLSGDINKDFITVMALHQKHGEEMARTEVKYGKDPGIQNLAKKMAEDQRKELKQLTALMD